MARHTKAVAVILLLSLLGAACGEANTTETNTSSDTTQQPEVTTSVEGDSGEAVTLRMARTGGPDPRVQVLIDTVAELSDGALQIEEAAEWDITGTTPDVEQQIIAAVADGEIDLGFVGTRAFPPLGVHNFDALTAPFLVDSYPLQQVILDSDIPERMLPGLDQVGVIGLSVMAGGLRKPAAVNGPLLGLDDYTGTAFYVFPSEIGNQALTTLGATPAPGAPLDRDAGLVDGTIEGMENTLGIYEFLANLAPYITLNVNLWPYTAVLITNHEVLDDLTDMQAEWLGQAADTAARSVDFADVDAELMNRICTGGGRFFESSEVELAALRDAVEPVYQQLRNDQLTADLIDQIQEMKASMTVEDLAIPDDCTGEPPSRDVAVAEGTDDPSVINGSYRLEWDADELFDALMRSVPPDAPPDDVPVAMFRSDAERNAGVVTLTFDNGRYDHLHRGENCPGTYAFSGDRITMVATSDPAEWECGTDSLGRKVADAAWELTDQGLVLSDFILSEQPDITWWNAIYLSKPLTRVD